MLTLIIWERYSPLFFKSLHNYWRKLYNSHISQGFNLLYLSGFSEAFKLIEAKLMRIICLVTLTLPKNQTNGQCC